jgi:hypothetical protein
MLQAWVASNFQDDSRLPIARPYKMPWQWAADKSLSDLDYRYLSASQEWDANRVRQLEAKNQATAPTPTGGGRIVKGLANNK